MRRCTKPLEKRTLSWQPQPLENSTYLTYQLCQRRPLPHHAQATPAVPFAVAAWPQHLARCIQQANLDTTATGCGKAIVGGIDHGAHRSYNDQTARRNMPNVALFCCADPGEELQDLQASLNCIYALLQACQHITIRTITATSRRVNQASCSPD